MVVKHTNMYAFQAITPNGSVRRSDRMKAWTKAIFGASSAHGIITLHFLDLYLSPILLYQSTMWPTMMRGNRFQFLLHFSFCYNFLDGDDKLYKMCLILIHLSTCMKY